MLGPDSELEDTLHDVFVRAFESLHNLRDPAALDSWVMGVTVRTARTRLQRRARRWWLKLASDDTMPEPAVPARDPAADEALRATYRILDMLPVDERIALVLRFAAEMTIAEAATTSGVSVATIKRRLQRAERSFLAHAEREPALESWASGGQP
jgi:RNA polymerase sigma-70 factor (ECF subfamily)